MKNGIVLCGLLAAALVVPAHAVVFFDIDADPAAWEAALEAAGKVSKGTVDFGVDPDYGIVGFEGPLTSAGAGPVSPGVVLDNLSIYGPNHLGIGTDLTGVGPSAGFGNPINTVVAGYFTDSLQIDIMDDAKTAVAISVLTILGSSTMDVTATTTLGSATETFPAPTSGHNVGILAEPGEILTGINLFDSRPNGGVEGFMTLTAYNLPEASGLALLMLGAVAVIRRRR